MPQASTHWMYYPTNCIRRVWFQLGRVASTFVLLLHLLTYSRWLGFGIAYKNKYEFRLNILVVSKCVIRLGVNKDEPRQHIALHYRDFTTGCFRERLGSIAKMCHHRKTWVDNISKFACFVTRHIGRSKRMLAVDQVQQRSRNGCRLGEKHNMYRWEKNN